jgi:Cu/Ag efflux protein CusF
MRTSIIAASLLLTGAIVAAPLPASAAQKAKPASAPATQKIQSAKASGTLEKFDAATHQLVIKHDGKEQAFTVGDGVTVKSGAKAATVQDLSASIGHQVKLEYAMNNGARTVSLVEISAAAARPAKAGKTGK